MRPRSRRRLVAAIPATLGVLLALALPGPAWAATPPSDPEGLTALGSTVLFAADDGVNGRELWRSNGTAAGTKLVRNIASGNNASVPRNLVAVNGSVLFDAVGAGHPRSLWKTDGTTAGTKLVEDIAGSTGYFGPPTVLGTKVLMGIGTEAKGLELWVSNGTAAGTKLVKDINPGSEGGLLTGSERKVGNRLLFAGYRPSTGMDLWKSDGTAAGTVLVKDMPAAVQGWQPVAVAGDTYFWITEGPVHVFDLWKSNGTAAGTKKVTGLYDYSIELVGAGSLAYLVNYEPATGYELWKSNGTAAGTGPVKDIFNGTYGSYPAWLTARGSTLFFAAAATNGSQTDVELWKSNGTPSGTARVKDIGPGYAISSDPHAITNVGGTIYFAASDGTTGVEPYRSDGTGGGTNRVANIRAGAGSSDPDWFTKAGTIVYFVADDGTHGRELWRTTSGGAALVKDIAK